MAKFCTKCGKPLEEGKKCNCQEGQVEELLSNENNQKKSNSNEIIEQLLTVLKGTFKNPITTIKEIRKDNYFITGLITLGVNALAIALFIAGLLKSVLETIINQNSITSTINSLSGTKSNVDINVFGLGFKIFLLVVIFYGIYSLIAWLITNKIMKKNNTYKQIIATMSVPATISALSMLASWLLLLMLGTSGSILYCLLLSFGQVLFSVYLYHSLMIGTAVKEDYAGYTYFIAMFVSVFIVSIIASAMISSYIKSISNTYTPSSSSLFGLNEIVK